MRFNLAELIVGAIKTFLVLIFLEFLTSSMLPILGIKSYKFSFNVLIVLYLAFKIDSPFLAIVILLNQLIHSAFSIEGWAINTFVGVLLVTTVNYLKDLLHFTSYVSTMILVLIFQSFWYIVISVFLSFKLGDVYLAPEMLVHYIPQAVLLTFISPIVFRLMDKFIWNNWHNVQGGN